MKGGYMKGFKISFFSAVFLFGFFVVMTGALQAQERGIPTEMIKNAYQQVLAGADKNGDGKLSMQECLAVSKDKARQEKNCKYWDANGDGIITEDEYVQQVKKIGGKKGSP
jgi:Ca2+-binding EF-hand superfamily protein